MDAIHLISLPDILKWDTSNFRYIRDIFSECISILSLPDISKWNISDSDITSDNVDNPDK